MTLSYTGNFKLSKNGVGKARERSDGRWESWVVGCLSEYCTSGSVWPGGLASDTETYRTADEALEAGRNIARAGLGETTWALFEATSEGIAIQLGAMSIKQAMSKGAVLRFRGRINRSGRKRVKMAARTLDGVKTDPVTIRRLSVQAYPGVSARFLDGVTASLGHLGDVVRDHVQDVLQ